MPNVALVEPRKPTVVEEAQRKLVERFSGVIFHRVVGEADDNDAQALVDDLLLVAGWFDEFIEAYGRYCKSELPNVRLDDFKNQVLGALEGNATYQIEQAREELIRARDEYWADPKGWNKAEAEGVS